MTAGWRSKDLLAALLLVSLGVMGRLLPHGANFAPVTALTMVAAVWLPRRYSWLVPLAIMMISDFFLGWHALAPLIWMTYAVTGFWASSGYQRLKSKPLVVAVTPLASGLFFVLSNLGVWLQNELYPRTLAGLANCFLMALPFLRNTVLSDVLLTAGLFTVISAIQSLPYRQKVLSRGTV
jgi:hypothetical protein